MAGLRCIYAPQAVVFHVGSGSTGGGTNFFKIRQMSQNMICLAVKNLHASLLVRVLPVWVLVQMVLMARLLFLHSRDRVGYLRAYWSGLLRGLALLPRMIARRRQNLARSRLSAPEVRAIVMTSERLILQSLLRSRGPDWFLAPAIRMYLRVFVRGLT
jgi:GT2 family glycosyltransferase